MAVYLDLETTGFDPLHDEVLEIGIVDEKGDSIIDTLVRPTQRISWPDAEHVHGITLAMVRQAPTLKALAPQIAEAVKGQDVVIYNASFDTGFLGDLLAPAKSVQCCMDAYSEHVGEWDLARGRVRWQSLAKATAAVGFVWPSAAHRANTDALACRAVWQFLMNAEQTSEIVTTVAEAPSNPDYTMRGHLR